jgi:hypothetical protein
VCSEFAETSLIDLSLACWIGKFYSCAGVGVVQEVFSGKIRPENTVRMLGAELDALSRLIFFFMSAPIAGSMADDHPENG